MYMKAVIVMDQEDRITELKRRVQDAAGGKMVSGEVEGLDADAREAFWTRIAAFEDAPERSLAERLGEAGFELLPARKLDDAALHKRLWALIRQLAEWRCYLWFTNHLSDRELYELLLDEVLPEPDKELPPELAYNTIIDLSEYDRGKPTGTTYVQYYADEQTRAEWACDWPECELPAHEDPPHDRDRDLPAEVA